MISCSKPKPLDLDVTSLHEGVKLLEYKRRDDDLSATNVSKLAVVFIDEFHRCSSRSMTETLNLARISPKT